MGSGYVPDLEGRDGCCSKLLLLFGWQDKETPVCTFWLRRKGRVLGGSLGHFRNGTNGPDDLVQDRYLWIPAALDNRYCFIDSFLRGCSCDPRHHRLAFLPRHV